VQASSPKKKFRPGELAPITGIYAVSHGLRHRERHEVVIIRGEQLPGCRTCKFNLTFEIIRPISHITHDWDFSGPNNLTVRPRQDDFRDFRMFHRVHVQLPITVELSPATSPVVVHGHSSDLSAGGLGAVIRSRLPARYKTGPVRVRIERGDEILSLRANFRYQTGSRYGFEFINIDAAEREAIRHLIETQKQRAADFAR